MNKYYFVRKRAFFTGIDVTIKKACEPFGDYPIPMKRDPLDFVQKYETRADQELTKVVNVNSIVFMLLKVDARLCQEVNRVLSVHVLAKT